MPRGKGLPGGALPRGKDFYQGGHCPPMPPRGDVPEFYAISKLYSIKYPWLIKLKSQNTILRITALFIAMVDLVNRLQGRLADIIIFVFGEHKNTLMTCISVSSNCY